MRLRFKPRRRLPTKKTFKNKLKKVLKEGGTYAAGGVAGYAISEGIDAAVNGVVNGGSSNNNIPIIVQMPAAERTTALIPVPAAVSSDLFDLKVLLLVVLVVLLVIILVGLGMYWIKSIEKRAVAKFKTELETPK